MKNTLVVLFAAPFSLVVKAQAVSADAFEKAISNGDVQLLDVRTPAEFKNAHLKNSLQADWNNKDQFKDRLQYIDKSKPVYVYCAAGVRSIAAAKWMRENGFREVVELQGGINAWNADKKPTEGQPAEKQITPAEFASMVSSKKSVLVDFSAPWCPPCKKMEPVTAALEKDVKGLRIIRLDPTVQVALAGHMNINTLPTFVVYQDGKETFRKEGIASYAELKKALQ